MDFADGRHPQFLSGARLFKNGRRALPVLFGSTRRTAKPPFSKLPGRAFDQAVGSGAAIAGEIERQSASAVERDPPWIRRCGAKRPQPGISMARAGQ
jgi:hypothetical protein